MTNPSKREDPPLALIINAEEWTARSLESILRPEGYVVLRAFGGAQGIELAGRVRPDIVLINHTLPKMSSVEVCRRLRQLATIRANTPIAIFSSGFLGQVEEIEALRAGAWIVVTPPFNAEALVARLEPLVAAKRDSDRIQESVFLDPSTGFYNVQGLMRRVAEVSADMARSHRPVACLVLGTNAPDEPHDPSEENRSDQGNLALSSILLAATRSSDSIGRIGRNDFVVLAPGTSGDGAGVLAQRILARAERRAAERGLGELDIRAGLYSSEGDSGFPDIPPEEFLRRATLALRDAQQERGNVLSRIRAFQAN